MKTMSLIPSMWTRRLALSILYDILLFLCAEKVRIHDFIGFWDIERAETQKFGISIKNCARIDLRVFVEIPTLARVTELHF